MLSTCVLTLPPYAAMIPPCLASSASCLVVRCDPLLPKLQGYGGRGVMSCRDQREEIFLGGVDRPARRPARRFMLGESHSGELRGGSAEGKAERIIWTEDSRQPCLRYGNSALYDRLISACG
jgi:hypothetical protein